MTFEEKGNIGNSMQWKSISVITCHKAEENNYMKYLLAQ